MIDINICIINTNNKKLLLNCLNSIKTKCLKLNYKIYLLDNASDDGSYEIVKKIYPKITIIKNDIRLGLLKI